MRGCSPKLSWYPLRCVLLIRDFIAMVVHVIVVQDRVNGLHNRARAGVCYVMCSSVVTSVFLRYFAGGLLPNTFHNTFAFGKLVRTKYFFNARYLWTKEQLEDASAKRAEGSFLC